jgi:hypothetical protein
VSAFPRDVIEAAAGEQEVSLTTYGRHTGKASDVTILIVTDGERLFILSGQGMVRHWPQNLVSGATRFSISGACTSMSRRGT